MAIPVEARIEYSAILRDGGELENEELISFLMDELPQMWSNVYRSFTNLPTEIVRIPHNTFAYLLDIYATLEPVESESFDTPQEARVVAAYGRSQPKRRLRDDDRLRGWVGKTEKYSGSQWDKGHFIAHSIGGAVDGVEMNVFVQRRDLNRGWSAEGKTYREMESYCSSRSGAFCFSRPLYLDGTARPSFVEFGLLKEDNKLWVECFDNQ